MVRVLVPLLVAPLAACVASGEGRQRSLYGTGVGDTPSETSSTTDGTLTTSISAGDPSGSTTSQTTSDGSTSTDGDGFGSTSSGGPDADPPGTDGFPVGTSTWTGTYGCVQGLTALQLSLTFEPGAGIEGVFAFGPHRSTPTLPHGSFEVFGAIDPVDGSMTLEPGEWIDRPDETWISVGLTGIHDPVTRSITGSIDSDHGCADFEVIRQ